MSTNSRSDGPQPVSRRGLLASALAAGTVGALAGAAAPAAAAELPPQEPDSPWVKGSGLKLADEWVPLPADYPWRPGRMIYYTIIEGDLSVPGRRQWAVVLPDGSQRSFPETAFFSQLRMAFAERGWRWESTSHPAASHVVVYLSLNDFLAAGLGNAPAIA